MVKIQPPVNPDGYMPQAKTSSSIALVAGVAAVALAATIWLNVDGQLRRNRQDIAAVEQRLAAAEQTLQTLEPVRRFLANGPQRLDMRDAYQAGRAVGPPDARGEQIDSPGSWCPASRDGGTEWLALTYDPPVMATKLRIHANYAPSAVVRVTALGDDGRETELWAGEPAALISFAAPQSVHRIKLHLDTAKVPGWNEIDAVAAVDAAGNDHWASGATASSEWKQP